MRIALSQINVTVGDIDGNIDRILHRIKSAKETGVELIAFPELSITGYPPEDLIFKSQFIDDNLAALNQIVSASENITVVVGYIERHEHSIYNAAAIINDKIIIDTYKKMILPNYGVFDEQRYFTPGTEPTTFDINGIKTAINICEDIWSDKGPVKTQRDSGAKLLININASPYHRGKREQREALLSRRAAENNMALAYVNLVGGQDELVFDGTSVIVSPEGEMLARASQFAEDNLIFDIDLEEDTSTKKRRVSKFNLKKNSKAILREPMHDLEEVYSALVTGTKDYVNKSGFEKVIVAISGGIDSALVTTIAVDALGRENVVGLSMPSRYSSKGSVTDSELLAENLGIKLLKTSIEPVFSEYLATLKDLFMTAKPNIAEENLQSRTRGTLVMAMSNKFGWLALTTGNKSEYATGYATLYGDMAGGFAVIKDVPKTLVYKLCKYRNSINRVIPTEIIQKPPSAELKPNQLDEDSLPPYDQLDKILKAYVEDDKTYKDIISEGQNEDVVRRVISLVDNSEHKRRQTPPGVKITERNFGRDRRMPIVNRYKSY
ncbi:MAG: NAD+ synthase [Dehalococcoidia bacterium]|nr:NAD+ synthase [Dehalococcoidia bacterium]MQG16271.1 NAD+ synthase [SAR202 cluster bacterium]|tara:strand:+ start:88 stop:1740 length:1653 start_codon:yes stop_codon:yes gene_type:complete